MTIAVAIKTGSAVVFAADSKVTTQGIAGLGDDGTPNLVTQTYDNAYKIAHDRSRRLMAMVAGAANLGRVPAPDFISAFEWGTAQTIEEQDHQLQSLLTRMSQEKDFASPVLI